MMKSMVVLVAFGAFAAAWFWPSSVRGSEPDIGEHLRSKSHPYAPLTTARTQAKFAVEAGSLESFREVGDPCDAACDFCWCGTEYEQNCPIEWFDDADCDCGCQYCDTGCPDCDMQICGAGNLPDLIIQTSSRTPSTGVVPGGAITLSDTVENQGPGAAESAFWTTWYISQDIAVTTDDFEWAFHQVPAGLGAGQTAGGYGDVPWPDVAPYNTPGQIYYVAVMADDLDYVAESDETNNWGEVWPVVLAGGSSDCPGEGDCCQDNGTPGCDYPECCELVCSVDSFCCDVEWSQACADLAQNLCTELCSGHEACPGQGSCCSPNGTVGCDDPTCCNVVCAADPFCCNTEWDATCAIEAEDLCESVCPGLEDDVYEPDNLPADATPLSCGQTQTHTIPTNGDVDWFAVDLSAGELLNVETSNLDGANPDTVLELYDNNCTYLALDDDGGSEPWASHLEWTAVYTGIHYIKARTFGGEIDHCNSQGGGPKSCMYDITFACEHEGACCQDGTCSSAVPDDCADLGGTYQGDDTVCEGDADLDGTDGLCGDECPDDGNKLTPGVCGCGTPDDDTDADGVEDCVDPCPIDKPDDTDGDGVCDSDDPCPIDNPDDTDGDGACDSDDACPTDPDKTDPGVCGCGVPDDDSDMDGVADCQDQCPGEDDTIDHDGNGTPDCLEDGIPTMSQWGLLITGLLMLVTWKVQGRRRPEMA